MSRLRFALAATAAILIAAAAAAAAQTQHAAKLVGHAILPAESVLDPPADAPADLKTSGKFIAVRQADAAGTVTEKSGGRPAGISPPFKGQSRQGHSGIKAMPDGSFWVLTDNGFGSKSNSPDAMLFLNRYRIDWTSGTLDRLETIFLHDPDRRVPFRIVHESTDRRYLTGADFDIEGFQWVGDTLWLGDEFGPYVIKADKAGRILGVFETLADGMPVRSPDHPALQPAPAPGTPESRVNLRRSNGYEGFAASRDGRFLYGLLEGPLWQAEIKDWEKIGGKEAARILEFDISAEKFTGRFWYYVFEANGHAIGDFNMLDTAAGLVIERDNREGTADKACPQGQNHRRCFADVARFKRVYKIELSDANAGRPVRKVAWIDLMTIRDPDRKARKPLNDGLLALPFSIENVDVVDSDHIVVGNDNNLPFSSSRAPDRADDSEFVLLEAGDFLRAD